MKKILIASSCALMLCFTSCATKQAPETDSQVEVPPVEMQEEEAAEETKENEAQEAPAEEVPEEESSEEKPLTSEDFPQPEEIDEPEIITLEPVEEEVIEEKEAEAEEVHNEEPPEITIIDNNENKEAAPEAESPEAENTAEGNDNDIIIADASSDSDEISGGIDITDDDVNQDLSLSDVEKDITPSRSVTLKKFEYLDVTYPGTGWIYMGLTDNSKDLAYFGRKLGTKDTKFSLQARAAGTKIIHFYRNDPLTGQYLDDYIEVIITAENGSNKTHIEAPEYKLPVQKKEKPAAKTEEVEEEKIEAEDTASTSASAKTSTGTSPATTSSTTASTTSTAKASANTSKTTKASTEAAVKEETSTSAAATKANTNTSSTTSEETYSDVSSSASETLTSSEAAGTTALPTTDSLLKEAQVLYNEKEYASALKKINQFFEYSTDNNDQALYLKGQILEAKSDVRDIKGAIDAYTTLTKNYPSSKYWDDANKRIIYLKRFYLEVR